VRNRIRHIQQEREGGFTLIELLIVIVVLGILAGIVVFGIGTFRGDSQLASCKATLKTISVAADAYEANPAHTYPANITPLLPVAGGPGYLKDAPDPLVVGTLAFNTTTHRVTSSTPGCTIVPAATP
jgi:prepilin-type N-terminal cleavage/methylation domain-containing protein